MLSCSWVLLQFVFMSFFSPKIGFLSFVRIWFLLENLIFIVTILFLSFVRVRFILKFCQNLRFLVLSQFYILNFVTTIFLELNHYLSCWVFTIWIFLICHQLIFVSHPFILFFFTVCGCNNWIFCILFQLNSLDIIFLYNLIFLCLS